VKEHKISLAFLVYLHQALNYFLYYLLEVCVKLFCLLILNYKNYYVKGPHHLKSPLLCFLCSHSSFVPNNSYEKLLFMKCKPDSFS